MSIAAKANALWEYANPRKFMATTALFKSKTAHLVGEGRIFDR